MFHPVSAVLFPLKEGVKIGDLVVVYLNGKTNRQCRKLTVVSLIKQ
jgi:hypothetical protein